MFICILNLKNNKTKQKGFSVVNCLERSQSQCISVDPVSVMYVCLTTLGEKKYVTGWDFKVQKMQAFLFLQLIVLMHFVPVEFFILEIKGYNKKKILEKKNLSGLVVWPDPDWSPSLISSWYRRKLAFDIRFSRRFWLHFVPFFFLFPNLRVFLLLFSLSFAFVYPLP